MKIYFDHAATSYMYDEVVDTMSDLMRTQFGNPSSIHSFGQEAKAQIESARKSIASLVGAEPQEIVFTSSGTESNNLVIRGAVEKLGVKRIITTLMEHKCVLETTMAMRKIYDVQLEFLPIDENGDYSLETLEQLLDNDTPTLVSLMHANNEVGNIYPIKAISEIVAKYPNSYLHSDTIQTIGHFPVNLSDMKVDFASASAHKFHGPKGAGFTYINKNSKLSPIIFGGGQERNMRSGTENVYGIVGMAKALEISVEKIDEDMRHLTDLKNYAISELKKNISGIQFNGRSDDLENSLYTVLNIFVPTQDPMLGFKLDMKGIAISQGSACSSGASNTSMVISRLRTDEELVQNAPIRISLAPRNTAEEVDYFVKQLQEILANTPKQKV